MGEKSLLAAIALLNARAERTDCKTTGTMEFYRPLFTDLDNVMDEIKSADKISDHAVDQMLSTLEIVRKFPHWHMQQLCIFGYGHVFRVAGEVILSHLNAGHAVLPVIFGYLSDYKRELRDAAATVMGSYVAHSGEAAVAVLTPHLDKLTAAKGHWQSQEGLAKVMGDILARGGGSFTEKSFDALFSRLEKCCQNQLNPAFSSYIRWYAIKSLDLVIRAGCEHLGRHCERISGLTTAGLADGNINVRRQASKCTASWTKQQGTSVAEEIERIKAMVSSTKLWPSRHGGLSAIAALLQLQGAVDALPFEEVRSLLSFFSERLNDTHGITTGFLGPAAIANGAAVEAAVDVYASLCGAMEGSEGVAGGEEVDAEVAALTAALAGTGLGDATASKIPAPPATRDPRTLGAWIVQLLVRALQSSEANIIDTANQAVIDLVVAAAPHVSDGIPALFCAVFKNLFHASNPVKDSATRAFTTLVTRYEWSEGVASLRTSPLVMSEDVSEATAFVASEYRSIAKTLVPGILAHLLPATEAVDCDVRESAFLALEDMLTQGTFCPTQGVALGVELFVDGLQNETGASRSDEPRAAAVKGVAAFITFYSKTVESHSGSIAELSAKATEAVVPVLVEQSATISEAILQGICFALQAISSYLITGAEAAAAFNCKILAVVGALSQNILENTRYHATPVWATLLGGDPTPTLADPVVWRQHLTGLVGAFSLGMANEEEEGREAVARLLALAAHSQTAAGIQEVEAAVARRSAALLVQGLSNIDVIPFASATARLLYAAAEWCKIPAFVNSLEIVDSKLKELLTWILVGHLSGFMATYEEEGLCPEELNELLENPESTLEEGVELEAGLTSGLGDLQEGINGSIEDGLSGLQGEDLEIQYAVGVWSAAALSQLLTGIPEHPAVVAAKAAAAMYPSAVQGAMRAAGANELLEGVAVGVDPEDGSDSLTRVSDVAALPSLPEGSDAPAVVEYLSNVADAVEIPSEQDEVEEYGLATYFAYLAPFSNPTSACDPRHLLHSANASAAAAMASVAAAEVGEAVELTNSLCAVISAAPGASTEGDETRLVVAGRLLSTLASPETTSSVYHLWGMRLIAGSVKNLSPVEVMATAIPVLKNRGNRKYEACVPLCEALLTATLAVASKADVCPSSLPEYVTVVQVLADVLDAGDLGDVRAALTPAIGGLVKALRGDAELIIPSPSPLERNYNSTFSKNQQQ